MPAQAKSRNRTPGVKFRTATIARHTAETRVDLQLTIEGQGRYSISTGIRFFDHMLELFTRHGACRWTRRLPLPPWT
jgi:imidazoleglycerol-phosphate dehydratase